MGGFFLPDAGFTLSMRELPPLRDRPSSGDTLYGHGGINGANCHPCLEHHVGKALEAGIDRDDLMEAVEVVKAVRKGAASSMDKLALGLVRDRLPGTSGAGGFDPPPTLYDD